MANGYRLIILVIILFSTAALIKIIENIVGVDIIRPVLDATPIPKFICQKRGGFWLQSTPPSCHKLCNSNDDCPDPDNCNGGICQNTSF